jgi:phage shock protein C
MEKKLYRDAQRKMIGGVCAGLADYFDIDATVIRLVFLISFFVGGVGLIPYIVLWIVLPKRYYNPFTTPSDPATVNYMVPPMQSNTPFTNMPPRRRSNGGLIAGAILILIGTAFLLNEYDIIPDWDYGKLWPLVFVGCGLALIVAGQQKKPWEHTDWPKTADTNTADNDNSINNNPPTV